MRLRNFSFFAVLPIVAVLLSSCNEVSPIDFDADSFADRNVPSIVGNINVTLAEAKGIADRFAHSDAGNSLLPTKSGDSRSTLISTAETIREDGEDLMYVFNYEDGGFVIVGSTRNYYPILAYSDKGSFELSDDMGPVDVWLDETKVCLKNSPTLDDATKAQMQQLWARFDGTYTDPTQNLLAARRPQTRSTGEDACWERCETLQALYGDEGWTFFPLSVVEDIFTEAGLSNYYADICYSAAQNNSALNETVIGYRTPVIHQVGPLIGIEWFQWGAFGHLCPNGFAGCGAVAAGQVMKYYEWPDTLSYYGDMFTWANLPDQTNILNTSYKHPEFMMVLGQKFQMVYDQDGSRTNVTKIKNGLDTLKYYSYDEPHSTLSVRDELFIRCRPVIMFGVETTSPQDLGHFWVCEGAREIIYDAIQFYTENQPYSTGNFTQGLYSYGNPGEVGGSIINFYFYMNWGAGHQINPNYNGWFASNNVNMAEGNYQYQRKNIYLHPNYEQ